MSYDPNNPDPDDGPRSPADFRDQIEQLRKESDARVEEATADLARELAFTKAGIDTDTPAGQIFARGYDGELDVDAIKAAASALGLNGPADPSSTLTEPTAVVPDPASEREKYLIGAGAALTGEPPAAEPVAEHPAEVAMKAFDQASQGGSSRPEAMGFGFNALVSAAASGDQRAILPPDGIPDRS